MCETAQACAGRKFSPPATRRGGLLDVIPFGASGSVSLPPPLFCFGVGGVQGAGSYSPFMRNRYRGEYIESWLMLGLYGRAGG